MSEASERLAERIEAGLELSWFRRDGQKRWWLSLTNVVKDVPALAAFPWIQGELQVELDVETKRRARDGQEESIIQFVVTKQDIEMATHVQDAAAVQPSIARESNAAVPVEYENAPLCEELPPKILADVGPVDIAILTVLPEEYWEMYAALGPGSHLQGSLEQPNEYAWSLHEVTTKGGQHFRVVLGQTAQPTRAVAQAATQRTIDVLSPRYLLWAGVCGGIRGLVRRMQ